ncbi:hypothetical protein B0H15DRAFT_1020736 [Mycena belliarum]|uniref:Uncharacterized protein n=1 Tax=Mycena belliarum TaxID=1033014 RepID=A0AAD6UCF5_9AGAR|nr:hypothetical protein B0H15DRAFT_1020736 [Mycena belliae]
MRRRKASRAPASPSRLINVGVASTSAGGMYQFDPPTVRAPNGTVILFQFSTNLGNHSIIQSTYNNPCTAKEGGFDSGVIVGGQLSGGHFPTWSYNVTNDQNPIWFFYESKCTTGMVGGINLQTAKNTLSDFQTKAQGFSTALPTANRTTVVASSTTTTDPTSVGATSLAPSTVPTNNDSSPGKQFGTIVGATIGGLVIVALSITALLLRRRRRLRNYRTQLAQTRPYPLILNPVIMGDKKVPPAPENTVSVLSSILREVRSLRQQMRRSDAQGQRQGQRQGHDRTDDPPPTYAMEP